MSADSNSDEFEHECSGERGIPQDVFNGLYLNDMIDLWYDMQDVLTLCPNVLYYINCVRFVAFVETVLFNGSQVSKTCLDGRDAMYFSEFSSEFKDQLSACYNLLSHFLETVSEHHPELQWKHCSFRKFSIWAFYASTK